jgi:hypothetical protein
MTHVDLDEVPDDYGDLTAGAVVWHPKWGRGVIVEHGWVSGRPLVKFDRFADVSTAVFCNPDRLSTDA